MISWSVCVLCVRCLVDTKKSVHLGIKFPWRGNKTHLVTIAFCGFKREKREKGFESYPLLDYFIQCHLADIKRSLLANTVG